MKITSVQFENFKAFSKYSLSIEDLSILVGPNNNGKSTILDAFRILQAALRYAVSTKPILIKLPNGESNFGYIIPKSSIPVSLRNIQTNYSEEPATIRFKFLEGQNLYLLFEDDNRPILYYDTPRKLPKNLKEFKKEFDIKISVMPTLGPFEIDEDILVPDYVKRWWGSRRSSRIFRNIWYHLPDKFNNFKDLVEKTWPNMTICKPEKADMFSKQLYMFCEENMIKREISWVGFGFQVWLQLLTHIVRFEGSDMIIVDEPEIYLHPDLQHKILSILKSYQSTIILATHSVEIINDADPSDVILIDKNRNNSKRITDLKGLQEVANILGSGSNIHLTRLARGKKILFVEGEDLKILKKLASIIGFSELFSSGEITVIPINGFSQYERIINANWAFSKVLGQELTLSVLLDRDYRCDEEVKSIEDIIGQNVKYINILKRKEIENYLLVPQAIERAIEDRLKSKSDFKGKLEFDINVLMDNIMEKHREDIFGQLSANVYKFHQSKGKNLATIISEETKKFNHSWANTHTRLFLVPGKTVISNLNSHLQDNYGISISTTSIISKMKKGDIPEDLFTFFSKIEEIRLSKK